MRRARVLCAIAVVMCAGGTLSAQRPPPPSSCTGPVGEPPHGTVRGRVVNDSTGAAIRRHAVWLGDHNCETFTDDSGRFAFTGVHVGKYSFIVAPTAYRPLEPIAVTVAPSAVTVIEARLRWQNRIEDCRAMSPCAAILDLTPPPGSLTDDDALTESALRTSIAIVVLKQWRLGEFAICIGQPYAGIRAPLGRGIPRVVDGAECEIQPPAPASGSRLTHLPTGSKAVRFDARILSRESDRATAEISHHVGPRYAEGWQCEFKRDAGIWKATACRMTWIS